MLYYHIKTSLSRGVSLVPTLGGRFFCLFNTVKMNEVHKMFDYDSFDNYVFDLYGTLIDISTDEWRIETWEKWADWLDAHGYRHDTLENMRETFFAADKAAREYAKENWGYDYPEIDVLPIYRDMFASYGNPSEMLTGQALEEIGSAFRIASRIYARLFPGVEDFLLLLRKLGKKTYILSNAQRSYTWPEICEFGLKNMVDDILISSDYECMKPDKAFYGALASKYNFDVKRTIMFGDSFENDYKGALNVGWNALHLSGENASEVFYIKKTKEASPKGIDKGQS